MGKSSRESRILTVLFFGPPVLVALALFGPWELEWLPRAEAPYGARFDPPIALPQTTLTTPGGTAARTGWAGERWSLIYARDSSCDALCLQGLELLQQVRLALPRDRELVQRVYLYSGDIAALEGRATLVAGLVLGRLDGPAGVELRRVLGERRLSGGYLFIADPAGNLVFSYPPDAQRQGIVRDLQRLLVIHGVV